MGTALIVIEVPPSKYPWATDQEVIDALHAHSFHIGRTARFFGVKRHVLANRIAETPALALEQQDFVEEVVDDAELHFLERASKGAVNEVAGVLNSLGRKRGYGKQDKDVGELLEVVIRKIASE